MNTKTEIPITYIKKEQIRIDYYYQISKAKKQKDIDKIIKNLEDGFGVLPEETKTLANTASLRVLLTGSLIKKVEGFNNKVVLFLKNQNPILILSIFFKVLKALNIKTW